MTSSRRKKVGAIAAAVVITLVMGACTGDDAGASQGATKLADRTLTPAATGGAETGSAETGSAETGPTETGPAETGPTVTGPGIRNTGDPSSVGFGGLPPEGATPSKPLHGELVMTDRGWHPWYAVFVYADGRLIWSSEVAIIGVSGGPIVPRWIEQRLTPEGVELLRSGAVPLGGQFENPAQGLPASAWEDRTLRPFVPSRYAECLWGEPPSIALDILPAEAKDLLRRSPSKHAHGEGEVCRELTLEDARVLSEILSDAGFELDGDQPEEQPAAGGPGGFVMLTDPNGPDYEGIEFEIVLPHGSWYAAGG